MAAQQHDHDQHDHGLIHYQGTDVDDAVLQELMGLHPSLAANLGLARRFGELTDEERPRLAETQREVEQYPLWMPGYHAPGDRCATCGGETTPLFTDRLQEGALPYAAFMGGLPVHATDACLGGFDAKHPNRAPRAMDMARRGLMKDFDRPSPSISQFFRHDLFAHPPFGLEDWANSVAEANPKGLDRATMRDMERLLAWVHRRLFHHH